MRVTKELAAKVKTSVYSKFAPQLEQLNQERENYKVAYIQARRCRRARMVEDIKAADFAPDTLELLLSIIRGQAYNHSMLGKVQNLDDLMEWADTSGVDPSKMSNHEVDTPEFIAADEAVNRLMVERTNTLQDVMIALEYTNKRDGIIDVMKEFGLDFSCGQQST